VDRARSSWSTRHKIVMKKTGFDGLHKVKNVWIKSGDSLHGKEGGTPLIRRRRRLKIKAQRMGRSERTAKRQGAKFLRGRQWERKVRGQQNKSHCERIVKEESVRSLGSAIPIPPRNKTCEDKIAKKALEVIAVGKEQTKNPMVLGRAILIKTAKENP